MIRSAILALALAGLACGGDVVPPDRKPAAAPAGGAERNPGRAVDPAPPAGEVPAGEVPTHPDSGWTAGIVEMPAAGGVSTLRAVRAAAHAGYDRVVWELAGPAPGVHVEYVDRPVRQCGSGDPVPLPGDAWLEVRLEPAAAHTEEGRPTMAARRVEPRLPVVLEVVQTCDFEAVVTWAVAARSPERFRVLRLVDPARIVIDVRHARR